MTDPDGKIAKLSDESLPSIGMPSPESARRALQSTGAILVSSGKRLIQCTDVSVHSGPDCLSSVDTLGNLARRDNDLHPQRNDRL
jgi:hypothetical protein